MTRVSACDGRYLSLAQQKRAWEELNRIFGGQSPTPPGPDPPGPDPPSVSDWSVYFSDTVAEIREILTDQEVSARVISIEYKEETMPEPIALPIFTLYGGPGEFAVLITEIEHTVDLESARLCCGMFRNGEFNPQYAGGIPASSHVNNQLLVEMFSCDGMGIVTYLSNLNPEGGFSSEMWSYTFSYDWAEGEMPGVCFMGFTANPIGMAQGIYHGTLGFAVLKEEV